MPNAIVTGATQGIGKALAEKLLHEGFSVAICARNQEKLKAVEAEWNERFPTASVLVVNADLTIKEDAQIFADTILSNFDEIDILVNNAGTYLPGTLADEPDGLLLAMLNANLFSAYRLTRCLLPALTKQGFGHIFNMCSVASLKAYPNGGSYSISKYALLGFSDNLREELKPTGIRVTSICPGATYTPSWESSGVAAERIMEAADVAAMLWAAYSTSPQANVDNIVMRPQKGDI